MASSSSKLGQHITDNSTSEKDINFYLPLYKAAIQGDWESASIFFDSNPNAVTARITENLETILHIAVGRSGAIHFVEKLVELMPVEALSLTNKFSETALHDAAKYGNTEAAKILVTRVPSLPHIWSDTNLLPLHLAAFFGHKEMVLFLLTVTKDYIEPNPFADKPGITLLNAIVNSGFYDVALHVVQCCRKLAVTISPGRNTALSIIAGKPSAFLSGGSLGFWQKFIYSRVPVKLVKISYCQSRDIENLSEPPEKHIDKCNCFLIQSLRKDYLLSACQKLREKFWEVIRAIVPQVKHIHDTKLMHFQAIELVKFLCAEISHTDNSTSALICKPAVITAATLGHYEVLEEILKAFPSAIWSLDKEHHDLFQMAVINRRETIFNLLYELDEHHAHLVTQNTDDKDNNILHLAGKLAPPHRLNLVAGAALQMQHELQWYQEVQNFVTPSCKAKENSDGKTPHIVFSEEHKDLITKGERWLKDTAKSCTFAGTLIATVAFAAAITVPGGSSGENGIPIFNKEGPFILFAISNAISLFSSVTSVLMFLFILTSRCAEADFLYSLPNKLLIGLLNLIFSLATMMIAFSAAIYILFGHKETWILVPLIVLACLPVFLFLPLQYPLLNDMIRSTYGPGIFGEQRKVVFD